MGRAARAALSLPGYTAGMRIFVRVLLLAVVLNLADWPYVDEIFGSDGPVSELLESKPAAPAQHSGAAKHVQQGYQLLAAMQAIPHAPLRLLPPSRDKVASLEVPVSLYLIPPRIDRPPIGAVLS
jgi:hypothetical protein